MVAKGAVQPLGEGLPLSQDNLDRLEELVCYFYSDRQRKIVDDLHFKSCCKGKNVQSHPFTPQRLLRNTTSSKQPTKHTSGAKKP